MTPERFRVGRPVDTELFDGAVVADGHVAVLPGDLRKLLLGDLLRAPADLGHRLFVDLERPDDQVPRHLYISTAGMAWSDCNTTRPRASSYALFPFAA